MSAQTIAILSAGLIFSGDFPAPFDVRFGVDNGEGELGTLTSPSQADVRLGVEYGGDGTQYTGLLNVPGVVTSFSFADNWTDILYPAQGLVNKGLQVVVTIQGYCINKPAVLSAVKLDKIFTEGGAAENGGWEIQMLLSDLSGEPPKGTKISCNGEASGHDLEVDSVDRNGLIAYITAVDFGAQNT